MLQTSLPTPHADVNLLANHCPTSPSLFLRLVVLLHASFKIAQPLEYFLRDTALVLPFIPLSRPLCEVRAHNRILCVRNKDIRPILERDTALGRESVLQEGGRMQNGNDARQRQYIEDTRNMRGGDYR